MTDDETTPVTQPDGPPGDSQQPHGDDEGEQLHELAGDPDRLPGWLQRLMESAKRLPGGTERLGRWLPTLMAAWGAADRGLALASTVRDRLEDDEPLQWPDELAAEFGETLSEFADTLPGFDDAVPVANELIEMSEDVVDPENATEMALKVTRRVETLAEKVLRRLIELAFLAPRTQRDSISQNRRLRNLFNRLEQLFDRLLYLWLFDDDDNNRDDS